MMAKWSFEQISAYAEIQMFKQHNAGARIELTSPCCAAPFTRTGMTLIEVYGAQ